MPARSLKVDCGGASNIELPKGRVVLLEANLKEERVDLHKDTHSWLGLFTMLLIG